MVEVIIHLRALHMHIKPKAIEEVPEVGGLIGRTEEEYITTVVEELEYFTCLHAGDVIIRGGQYHQVVVVVLAIGLELYLRHGEVAYLYRHSLFY